MTAGWVLLVFGTIWMLFSISMSESSRDPKWMAWWLVGAIALALGIVIP